MHFEYLAVTRGPLVYASGLIDGFKTNETLLLHEAPASDWLLLDPAAGTAGQELAGPTIQLHSAAREPLSLVPYYRAGGRTHGAWRLTWTALAPLADQEETEQ
jgi:hypothetical protein